MTSLPDVVFFQEGPGLRKFQFRPIGIPFLNIRTLQNGRINRALCQHLDPIEVDERYQHFLLQERDIVASSSGTLGKVAVIKEEDLPLMLNTSIIRFRPHSESCLSYAFIKWFLKTDHFLSQAIRASTGSAQVNFGPSHLKKMYFLLPPLNEQRRIVAKIEELTAHSRKAREALESMKTYESLLVSYYTSSKWKERKLGDYIEEYKEIAGDKWDKYPVVGLSNEGLITERKEPLGLKSAPKCKVVKSGCIVFNPIRFSIGSVARYRGEDKVIVSPEYQVITTKNTLSSELLYRYLRSSVGRSQLENESQGSVRYRVYLKTLQKITIPIAPPEMQQQAEEYLSTLNELFLLCDNLSQQIDRLDRSILAKAFRGELVPQDPNDEPASVLLDRIRAEREKLGTTKKKGRTSRRKTKPDRV